MIPQALFREYLDIPVITRTYTTACFLTTLAVIWRLITNFLFFGVFGFNFLFNIIFTYRYCRMLEEGSFRSRTGDFVVMFLFGGTIMTIIALFINILFLGQAFTIMLVYIWSRRNPYIRMNFFGLLTFHAPYLPWVILAFSLLLGNSVLIDLVGISVGHMYYFLEDVFPNQPHGFKILKTPQFIKFIFDYDADRNNITDRNLHRPPPANNNNDLGGGIIGPDNVFNEDRPV